MTAMLAKQNQSTSNVLSAMKCLKQYPAQENIAPNARHAA